MTPDRLGSRSHVVTPAANTSGPVVDHGGPVQTAPKVYVVFWHWTSDPSGEAAYLERFLSSVGSTSWLATVKQYGAGWTGDLLAGTWKDTTDLVPAHPTDAQIQAEALVAAKHFNTGNSVNVQIVVATPTGHSTPGFGSSFCGYHDVITADRDVTYTDLPYMTDAGGSCGEDSVNGSKGTLDGVSIVEGHELAESITDPLINAWYNASGEVADLCAWTDLANLTTSSGTFPVQPLWSNADKSCAQSPTSSLTGVLTTGGVVLAKAGNLAASWNQEAGGVSQLAIASDSTVGPLIGMLTTKGEAYATQGLLNAPVHEYTGVKQIAVATDSTHGPLIAVLTTSGEVFAKEGSLGAAWVHEYTGASHIAVASDVDNGPLIGVVTTGGVALVKEGSLTAAWTSEDSGVSQLALASDSLRGPVISILTTHGVAYTKEGRLDAAWVHEYTGASAIALASDSANGPLIGVVTTGGVALVKDGSTTAAWTSEDSGVSRLALGSDPLDGPLIEVLIKGAAFSKQGSLSAPWTHEYTGASQIASAD